MRTQYVLRIAPIPVFLLLILSGIAGRWDRCELCAADAVAAQWYVAPGGTAGGSGTSESPWDIETALGGGQKVNPGDTIWLLGGTYKHSDRKRGNLGYAVRLTGQPDMPIHVRAAPGQRVTIDGGLNVTDPTSHLWLWDLEILVSENLTQSRRFEETGSHPESYNRPHGGLNIYAGSGCKYINLVIHDNAQGVSFWSAATDSELHGCIIYDNGWDAPDRGHGHAIYTQNEKGVKTICDCIMTGGYGYTMHAYGSSRAYVDNYRVEGNICYNGGTFLIGGGRPSHGIDVQQNYLYNVSMQIGYSAPHNDDCRLRGNIIVDAGLSINRFQEVINEENLVLNKSDARPTDSPHRVVIRPNRFDNDRFHVAVFNWDRSPTVPIQPGDHLQAGQRYRLLDPRAYYGSPVSEGTYDGRPVVVPVTGEFAALVLRKG